ncbi:DNA-binding protein [Escherichia coli]|uniref:helix-turn-helix domain-containing transcriptional regulator n=1 Tax=Escherichia coli TaxID=562 RepID=UPI003338C294
MVEYIEDEEDIQAYLNAAIEEGDTKYFFKALGNIARITKALGLKLQFTGA